MGDTTLCYTTLCYTTLCYATPYYTSLQYTTLHYNILVFNPAYLHRQDSKYRLSTFPKPFITLSTEPSMLHKEMGNNEMKTISFMNNNSLKGRFFFLAILIQSRLDYILAMRDFFCYC